MQLILELYNFQPVAAHPGVSRQRIEVAWLTISPMTRPMHVDPEWMADRRKYQQEYWADDFFDETFPIYRIDEEGGTIGGL